MIPVLRKRPDVPACLVLDVRLPGLSGLDLQREVAAANLGIPHLHHRQWRHPMSVEAMKAGAVEFLTKPFRDQVLLDAIHHAIQRDRAHQKSQAEVAEMRARYEALTQRELEVPTPVVTGHSISKLPLSWEPAIQRRGVMKKMRAGSLTELVPMAEKLGIHSIRD